MQSAIFYLRHYIVHLIRFLWTFRDLKRQASLFLITSIILFITTSVSANYNTNSNPLTQPEFSLQAAKTNLVPSLQAQNQTPVGSGDGSWVWQNPLPQGNSLYGVSCVNSTFCVAVGENGTLLTYNGFEWSSQTTNILNRLTAVSCTSVNFCVAVGNDGMGVFYDGTKWFNKATGQGGFTAISCIGTNFCMAVSYSGHIFGYNGTTWTDQLYFASNSFGGVSCTSISFCVAVNSGNNSIWIYDGVNWSSQVVPFNGLISVSCTAPNACTAVGSELYSYNGSVWSIIPKPYSANYIAISCYSALSGNHCYEVGRNITPGYYSGGGIFSGVSVLSTDINVFRGISCTKDGFCIAVGDNGLIAALVEGGFPVTQSSGSNYNFSGVNCLAPDFCVAVGVNFFYERGSAIYDGTTWTSIVYPQFVVGGPAAVSCTNRDFCITVGGSYPSDGRSIFRYNGTAWISQLSDSGHGLSGVSCISSNFCIAVGSYGAIITYDGTSWTPQISDTNNNLSKVSCTAINFCIAVGEKGTILAYNGTSWTPQTSGTTVDLLGVSCSGVNFCMIVDGDVSPNAKPILIYNGTSWTSQASGLDDDLISVSCTSPTFCTVISRTGLVLSYDGTNWTSQSLGFLSTRPIRSINCVSPVFCIAVGENGTILSKTPGRLSFSQQPSGTNDKGLLTPQPILSLDNSNYTGKVSISIKTGTGLSGARLNGTTTLDMVLGKVEFKDLSIDLPGSGYVLVANAAGAKAESKAFDVTNVVTIVPGVPSFDEWDNDDLYTQATISSASGAAASIELGVDIGRYYGLVFTNTQKLIDVDNTNVALPADKERNTKLHGSKATLYLWTSSSIASSSQTLNLEVNGNPLIAIMPGTSSEGALLELSIPVNYLNFPDICSAARSRPYCLRDPSKSNLKDEPDSGFSDLSPVKNTIKITSPGLRIDKAYVFLNGVRPTLLMAGVDFGIGGSQTSDTSGDWAGTRACSQTDCTQNNWVAWLGQAGIPNWNAPRDGTKSIEDQQQYLRAGATFLNRVYGAKKINIMAHSMGGITSRQFTYDANVNPDKKNNIACKDDKEQATCTRLVKVDKLITLDSPHAGVGIASIQYWICGIISATDVPPITCLAALKTTVRGYAAQADLGTDQLKEFNKKTVGLKDSTVWNGKNPIGSKGQIWITNYTAYNEDYECSWLRTSCSSSKKLYRDDDDGFIEDRSALGKEYPKPGGDADDPNLIKNYANFYEVPGSDSIGGETVCRKLNASGTGINSPIDTSCHTYVLYSNYIKSEIDKAEGIFGYNKNTYPAPGRAPARGTPTAAQPRPRPSSTASQNPKQNLLTASNILPSNGSIVLPLKVDNISDLRLSISISNSVTTKVRIETATGVITIPDQAVPGSFFFPGPNVPAGDYKLILTTGSVTGPASYNVEVTAKSDLAIGAEVTPFTLGNSSPARLEVTLNNGAANIPVTSATVTATLNLASGPTTVTLVDTGTNGDTIANDGKYSVLLPTNLTSESLIDITANGTFSGNAFTRRIFVVNRIRSGEIKFNGAYSWQTLAGITSSTTSIDTFRLSTGVSVSQNGNYLIEGVLAAANGSVVATGSTRINLNIGTNAVLVNFDTKQIEQQQLNGPYRIISLRAYIINTDATREADGVNDTSIIPALNITLDQLNRPPFRLNGSITEKATDLDNVGKFRKLQVTIPLDVAKTDTYSYSAVLRAPNSKLVASVSGQANLTAGLNTSLVLEFSGNSINAAKQDGPYQIESLVLSDKTTKQVQLFIYKLGQTANYQYSQFASVVVNGNTLVVTIPSDDGSGSTPGTLSNALKQATTGQSITFALPGGVNTIQISGKLPSVPKGVNIQATCNAGKPGITLDGSGVPNVSEGLILGGSNNIYGLRVTKFKGTQIRALGNGNKISCVAAVR